MFILTAHLKNKKTMFLIGIFLLIFVLFFSGYIRADFNTKILMQNQARDLKLTGELTSDHVVQQNVVIPESFNGKLIDFKIFFATYQRTNSSQLKISLTQNQTKETVYLKTASLKDNAYAEIKFKDKDFRIGNAILEISSVGAFNGNAVTLALTKDVSQGTAIVDGVEQTGYGILHTGVFTKTDWSYLYLILFAFIYCLICLKFYKVRDQTVNYNFLLCAVLIITITIYRLPSLTVLNQIWAEGATNFYMGALNNGWITNLKQLDAGYLPLLTRLITLILVKVLHITLYFPLISQLISLLLISIFASIICLNYFRKIIASDLLRFFISLCLGLGLFHDYELYTFINFSYLGVIPSLFIMFVDLEKMKKVKIVFFSMLFFFIVSSKAYFIVFLPLYLLLLGCHIRRKNFKSVSFYLSTSISMLIQIIVVITNRGTWTTQSESNVSESGLLHMAFQGISLYIKNFYHLFYRLGSSQNSIIIEFILTFVLILSTFIAVALSKGKLEKNVIVFIICTQILALFSIGLSLSVPYIKNSSVWSTQFTVPYNRHFIFSNIFMFLGIIVWVINLLKSAKAQLLAGVFIILMYGFTGFNTKDIYEYENYSSSNWKDSYSAFEKGGCTTINPYPWIVCQPGTSTFQTLEINKDAEVQKVDLATEIPDSKSWVVNGLIIDKNNPWNKKIKIVLYDNENRKIAESIENTEATKRYGYFTFRQSLSVNHLGFYDENDNEITLLNPKLTFLDLYTKLD